VLTVIGGRSALFADEDPGASSGQRQHHNKHTNNQQELLALRRGSISRFISHISFQVGTASADYSAPVWE
jgi:hypothetical protein